jgi:DNA-binding transcriptional LysR family regulator
LRQIEIFLAVVEEGGFSAAGDKIRMVQPAVSIAVRKLEEQAGVKLLDRTGTKIKLTHEGSIFFNHVRGIVSAFDNMERHLRELQSLEVGKIAIGGPPVMSEFLLPNLISNFLRDHPQIRISTEVGTSDSIAALLASGSIDVAIVAGGPPPDDTDSVLLEKHPFVALVPKSSHLARIPEIEWETLLAQPLVLFPKGSHQRSLVEHEAALIGRAIDPIVESASARFITSMVEAGQGFSVAFAFMGQDLKEAVSVPIVGNPITPIWLCRRRQGSAGMAPDALFRWCEGQALAEQAPKVGLRQ